MVIICNYNSVAKKCTIIVYFLTFFSVKLGIKKKNAKLPTNFAYSEKIKRYSVIVDRLRILKNKIHVYAVLHFYNRRVSRRYEVIV